MARARHASEPETVSTCFPSASSSSSSLAPAARATLRFVDPPAPSRNAASSLAMVMVSVGPFEARLFDPPDRLCEREKNENTRQLRSAAGRVRRAKKSVDSIARTDALRFSLGLAFRRRWRSRERRAAAAGDLDHATARDASTSRTCTPIGCASRHRACRRNRRTFSGSRSRLRLRLRDLDFSTFRLPPGRRSSSSDRSSSDTRGASSSIA